MADNVCEHEHQNVLALIFPEFMGNFIFHYWLVNSYCNNVVATAINVSFLKAITSILSCTVRFRLLDMTDEDDP